MSSTSLPVGSLHENAAREPDVVPGSLLRQERATPVLISGPPELGALSVSLAHECGPAVLAPCFRDSLVIINDK